MRMIVDPRGEAGPPGAAASPAQPAAVAAPAPVVAPVIEPRSAPVKPEPAKPAIEWPTRVASREAASEPKPVDPPKAVAPEPVRLERPAIAVVEPVAPVAAAPVGAVP